MAEMCLSALHYNVLINIEHRTCALKYPGFIYSMLFKGIIHPKLISSFTHLLLYNTKWEHFSPIQWKSMGSNFHRTKSVRVGTT